MYFIRWHYNYGNNSVIKSTAKLIFQPNLKVQQYKSFCLIPQDNVQIIKKLVKVDIVHFVDAFTSMCKY